MANKIIKDYVIIVDDFADDLRKKVLHKLKEGYVMQGGCSITKVDVWFCFAQAMIKYDE
jgi:hypothetical protein